jgi:hypothetical protein
MRMLHMVICGPPGFTLFFYAVINGTIYGVGSGKVIEHKMCFDFPYNFCLKRFS